MLLLTAEHVTVRYGAHTVLEDVSLTLSAGELVALTGKNGAGKTTLLHTLAGLLPRARGTVLVLARDPLTDRRLAMRWIGFAPDTASSHELLTAEETFTLIARLQDTDARKAWERLARTFGLEAFAGTAYGALSRGQQKRLAVACALIHDARVLLLDEPTAGLDADGAAAVRGALQGFAREGGAVLAATHDAELIAQSTRVVEI